VPRERARAIADTLFAHGSQYTIYLAAVLDDKAYVRNALARDSSLANFEDTCHRRPISAATERGDLEMVKLLLDHGADPNLPEEGAPRGHALWNAVYHRKRELARLLVDHGADPNAMVESSGTPMMHALKDPELYELLTSHGGIHDRGDRKELERLIGDNDLAGVERMLEAHPALIGEDGAFWSEGILAGPSNGGTREMLALLIRHGARVPTVTKWGRQYYFKHNDKAAFLLENGMDPNHMNWHHTTLLHHVASEGDIAKARLLLDHGANIDAVDQEYRATPLGVAARWGRREMVAFLLERGADPNLGGAPWATPLAWARKKGHAEIEADLRRAGASS
jgi:ankyrin repeat protein